MAMSPTNQGRPKSAGTPKTTIGTATNTAQSAAAGRLRLGSRRVKRAAFGGAGSSVASLAQPGAQHDTGVLQGEEGVGTLLGGARGTGVPHGRALADPPSTRRGTDHQLRGLVLVLLEGH